MSGRVEVLRLAPGEDQHDEICTAIASRSSARPTHGCLITAKATTGG